MSKKSLVSVNILTHNSQDLIGPCLNSVLKQTYKDIEILVIDNASTDNTLKVISKLISSSRINIKLIKSKDNLGFAAGHNIGIKKCNGEYILCLNDDAVLSKNFIKNAIEAIEVDKKIGAIQGKLYKIRNMREAQFLAEGQTPNIIDSTGLLMFKNRRIVCRGQGEKNENQYKKGEIFGVDGAVALYRRKALDDIKLPIYRGATAQLEFEYFDEDFFMYKEDVDLAWRLRLYGWKSIYEPKAVGYHLRGAGEGAVKDYVSVVKSRKKISKIAKYYSFKNQRLMQIKNEIPSLLFRDFYRIIVKEICAWAYVLIFERYTWKAIKELFKDIPNALRKRKIIMARKKSSSKEMKRWFE